MELAEDTAYGELDLTPREFEELQPREFYKLMDGYKRRQRAKDYRRAYFISWMIAPHVTRAITADTIARPLWETKEERIKQAAKDRIVLREEFGLDG